MVKPNRNRLKCPKCGTIILTETKLRHCYKCETLMEFIGKVNVGNFGE